VLINVRPLRGRRSLYFVGDDIGDDPCALPNLNIGAYGG
jgi:hypothetical protein